jgi:hypothetical protein
MTAPVRVSEAETQAVALAYLDDFRECCEIQRWFCDEGWVTKQVAVDNLQTLADCAGFVELYGQDQVQSQMAAAFAPIEPLPYDYVARILLQWEADDAKRPPVRQEPQTRIYRTAESTIHAFWYVAKSQPTEYLRAWLARHPLDKPQLYEIWKSTCRPI